MMRVLKALQDKATTGEGKRLVLPEPRRIRFLSRAEGHEIAGELSNGERFGLLTRIATTEVSGSLERDAALVV
jgi:hypothetical protein